MINVLMLIFLLHVFCPNGKGISVLNLHAVLQICEIPDSANTKKAKVKCETYAEKFKTQEEACVHTVEVHKRNKWKVRGEIGKFKTLNKYIKIMSKFGHFPYSLTNFYTY